MSKGERFSIAPKMGEICYGGVESHMIEDPGLKALRCWDWSSGVTDCMMSHAVVMSADART